MPSKVCPVCKALMPSGEYRSHITAHYDQAKPRPGSTSAWRRLRTLIIDRDQHACRKCGATEHLEVHHLDGNWRNDTPANLETRCTACNPRGKGHAAATETPTTAPPTRLQ